MNRRRWLQFVSTLLVWLRGTAVAAVITDRRVPDAAQLTAFAPFLDTLLPADATPSATGLGIDSHLLAVHRKAGSAQLLADGCAWLDGQARALGKSGFAALPEAQREAIVGRAATAAPGSLPNVFFQRMRRDAMRAYYALPASWAALGYRGPPQPRGFPDHARAPGRGR